MTLNSTAKIAYCKEYAHIFNFLVFSAVYLVNFEFVLFLCLFLFYF